MSRFFRPIPALVFLLLTLVGAILLWPRTPRYHLVINQERVVEQVTASELGEALRNWANRQMEREVWLAHEDQTWRFRRAELGLHFSLADAEEQIAAALSGRKPRFAPLEVRIGVVDKWDLAVLEKALRPIRQAVERAPIPAALRVEGESVAVVPSEDGVVVETAPVIRLLREAGDQEKIALPVSPVRPEETTESVAAMGVRRLVAEWTTHYDPTIPRAENVERAAAAFDGLMLKPGEILSYNATVGPIDSGTGWREAYVIVGGELVPGIGGGVCQVATTLYGAALRANMEILERHPHQLAVSYIPPSEDAAVAQGWQDLKIRNTTPGHLLIQTESGGGTVTFRLYGDLPAGQEVRIESMVTGSQPFPTRLIDDPTLLSGQEMRVSAGAPGVRSEAYRLLFMNGELVKRELLSRDSYSPTAAVLRRGSAPPVTASQE